MIIGRCDGWMGQQSGCYISLRCGMRVGNEGGMVLRLTGPTTSRSTRYVDLAEQ